MYQMNSIRLDDDSARHAARLRDMLKESYVIDLKNYFSNLKQEIDWSAFVARDTTPPTLRGLRNGGSCCTT